MTTQRDTVRHSKDLVSVIMPAYNGEKVIEDSIKSVLTQTHTPIELIIIDDASSDDTFTRIKEHEHNSNVAVFKAIRHQKNLGLAATLNHGLRESGGEFVVILHQDCVLADAEWIAKALEYFHKNERTAVVTGYYGIPPDKLTFATKAFGVFRRQYHARNLEQFEEEVTFSEGKCDIYRRAVLEKLSGFPERFRIAGEDLYVSYKIRQLGYSIVKSYTLPVIQKFGPAADSLSKNLKKEFIFGKAMGGIFPMFKMFLFKRIAMSQYSKVRSLQRASQPVFVASFIILLLLAVVLQSMLLFYLILVILGIRYVFYVATIWTELLRMSSIFHKTTVFSFLEALAIAALGVVIDFVYTIGFGYGLVLYMMGSRL